MGWIIPLIQIANKGLSFCQLRVLRHAHRSTYLWNNQHSGSDGAKVVGEAGATRPLHIPVMLNEVMELLKPTDGQLIVDMTFGGGGHTREIIARAPNVRMFTLDRDPRAYEIAKRLSEGNREGQIIPLLGCFSDLHELLTEHGVLEATVDGFLLDLGTSSMQFDEADRGFSLSQDGPLDMRMDGERIPNQPTAADVVNTLDQSDLSKIIWKYGEEKLAETIAAHIVETRYAFGKITRTQQLAGIIANVFRSDHKKDKMARPAHVATKTFQALRIFVNNELNELNNGLELIYQFLKPGGICVALSFHSLEDRIVKRHMHGIDMDARKNMDVKFYHRNPLVVHEAEVIKDILKKRWKPVSKRVAVPSYEDTLVNPRARSAKLRAATKL